jgi:hypothetical protein
MRMLQKLTGVFGPQLDSRQRLACDRSAQARFDQAIEGGVPCLARIGEDLSTQVADCSKSETSRAPYFRVALR